jgi:predicted MFS family arabinose efflux permease
VASALVLALGAAVALGLARFSYALLLPPMRADLGWSYATAGAMNTVNAAGYLAGALAMPWLLGRAGPRAALVGGSLLTALLLAAHGAVRSDGALYALRFASGVASAAVFVAGGLMAAQLAAAQPPGGKPAASFVIGLYYGGTGLGILACALLLPPLIEPHWASGWWLLAVLALAASAVLAWGARVPTPTAAAAVGRPASMRPLAWGMAGYLMFGLGYIGYMTFVVTLLREQRLGTAIVVGFYALLGVAVMVSPWLWAGLLQRHRGGRPMALLNGLLALATVLPVLRPGAPAALASGALFGAVFLSVVGSTTALVRHNLPPAAWAAGISGFTIVFAAGQIVGPLLVGRLADAGAGLAGGFVASAALLALGALLASRQQPVAQQLDPGEQHAELEQGVEQPLRDDAHDAQA